jgi:hypothetical protein
MRPSRDGVCVCTSYRLCGSWRLCFLGRASAGSMNSEATIAAAIMVLRFFFIHRFRVTRSASVITQDSRADYDPIFHMRRDNRRSSGGFR